MDICHLKNVELETEPQKCKRRVAFRGDIVKDDSGSCAVEDHGHHLQIARLRWTSLDIWIRLPRHKWPE